MATLDDLSFRHRMFMRTYRFRSVDWLPGASLKQPLSESKFALVTTAALHLPEQPAYNSNIRGGDCSFRELPVQVDLNQLRIAHRSSEFDQTGAREDPNLVFPRDRFQELVSAGKVGALNHRHFSLMGSITTPGQLISETAPAVAELLRQDRVEAVFLLPV
ncbi:MAG TPA: glycine/sarcosine/betaine reductase selenoprotein B family protein [Candidatus Angelobacter sp.]|jgi:D-proline reductase (dithiol) PrdB|nr:glycine/sarcosine/betaine reductase selenoprotein B family protein [Candidatus Angelobacter sp.]